MDAAASVADAPVDLGSTSVPDTGTSAPDTGADAPSPSAEGLSEVDADTLLENTAREYDAEKGRPAEEAKPSAETTAEGAPKEGEEEAEGDKPYQPVLEPENLKKAWKSLQRNHPEVYKAVRDSYFKTKAYEENFTVPEVRELRQLFESPQAAREARQAQADFLAADAAIHERPADLLKYLAKNSPQGFEKLATSLPQVLYDLSPQVFAERVSGPAIGHYLGFFDNQAQQSGDEDLKAAIEIIRDRDMRWRNGARQQVQQRQGQWDQNNPFYRELMELRQRDANSQAQVTQGFKDGVDGEFQNAVASEIDKMIERSGADLSDAGRQEVISRTLDDVIDRILEDPVLQRQLSWATRSGTARDAASSRRLVDGLVSNARRFLGPAAARHLTWLTEQIVKTNAKQLTQSRTSPHKEVSGATPGTPSGGRISKQQLDQMTPDQIIQAAADGKL